MFRWLFGPKQDWRLVKTLEWAANQLGTKGTVFVHLYESDRGNRKWKVGSTFHAAPNLRSNVQVMPGYHKELVPWLAKRYVPGIPTYNDVPSEDVTTKLSQP